MRPPLPQGVRRPVAPAPPDVPRVPDVAAAEPHADAARRGHAAGNGEDVVTIGTEILPCFSFSNLFWFLTDTAAEM